MSMRPAHFAEYAGGTAYAVHAPHIGDIMSVTLRSAYGTPACTEMRFGELLDQLDLIEIIPVEK